MSSDGALVQPTNTLPSDPDELFRQLMQLVGRDLGLDNWGSAIYHTSFDSDSEFAHTIENQGTGGHLNIPGLLSVTNSGVTVGALSTTGTITASRFISTVATGTAPFTVTSTTEVANLSVAALQGHPATDFVLKAGDTMTGVLQVRPVNDQAIKLQHTSGDGVFSIGASHAADPVMVFKDNSGDQTFEVGNSSSTYQAVVTGKLNVTDKTFVSQIAVGTTSFAGTEELRVNGETRLEGVTTITTGGANITGGIVLASSGNIDGNGGTAGQIRIGAVIVNQSSLDGSEELLVNGQSKLKGDVLITTGTFRHESGGNARIEANSTGLGFFNATPIARPAVTGSRGGNAALQSLCDQLADLGLISDLTT